MATKLNKTASVVTETFFLSEPQTSGIYGEQTVLSTCRLGAGVGVGASLRRLLERLPLETPGEFESVL